MQKLLVGGWCGCALAVAVLVGCGSVAKPGSDPGTTVPPASANGAPYAVWRFFSPGAFHDKGDFYGGEMASTYAGEPTIGEQLPKTARVSFRRLPNPGGAAVWHASISVDGNTADWYAYLESNDGGSLLSAVRVLAVPAEAAVAGPGFRLALAPDSAIRRFGLAHLADLRKIAAWLSRHRDPGAVDRSSENEAGSALSRLDFSRARLEPAQGDDVFIAIAGVTDNTTGYVYVPPGGQVPVMDGRELIYVERFAPGWYVYKTT